MTMPDLRWLAFAGGAVLGWVAVAPLVIYIRGLFAKDATKSDGVAVRLMIRLVSSVAAGVLCFFFVGLVAGGWGFGGGGDGVKDGVKDAVKDAKPGKDTGKGKDKDSGKGTPEPAEVMRVEVLGEEPLKKLARGGKPDLTKCYRVGRKSAPLSLVDLKALIRGRMKGEPPLKRLKVTVYKDSPEPDLSSAVTDLISWARDMNLIDKGFLPDEPDTTAPVD